MEIECVKEKLEKAVSRANRVTGKHASLPVLSNILIIAQNSKLIVRATNLDVGVEIEIPAKVKKDGAVAVPGGVLVQLLTNLSNDKKVTLTETNQNVHIKTESSETTITGNPHDEFPTLPMVSDGDGFHTDAEKLVTGIQSVVYSASTSSVKPELSSVYMYPENDTLMFVSTDSFRLAEKQVSAKKIPAFSGVIIPYKNANEIAHILSTVDGGVDVRFSKTQIAISIDDVYITSRLIDATFPDYKQIIPKEEQSSATVLKQDILSIMKVNTIFANKFNQVFFHLDPQNSAFSIETKNAGFGENKTSIPGSLSGEAVDLSINYKYINDALPVIKDDSVSLSFHGANKPVIMRGVSDKTFRYLVMPMNR